MPDANLREIILAFHEKGWNLYEETTKEAGNIDLVGPVDNLLQDAIYVVLPVMDDPGDARAAYDEGGRARRAKLGPTYAGFQGTIGYIRIRQAPVVFHIATDAQTGIVGIDMAMESAAEMLRKNLSEYSKEAVDAVLDSPLKRRLWQDAIRSFGGILGGEDGRS